MFGAGTTTNNGSVSIAWRHGSIGLDGWPKQAPDLLTGLPDWRRISEPGQPMSDLPGTLRALLHRFGRPEALPTRTTDLTVIDQRLENLEQEQFAIAARLRLLELQGDPRGRGMVDGC